MSTPVGNSAANASGNGPALGYSLKLWLFILFMLICVISINMFTCFILLLKVIEILLVYTFNFGIKLCPKLPKFLTIRRYLGFGLSCSQPPSSVAVSSSSSFLTIFLLGEGRDLEHKHVRYHVII